ncbi:uncharacterized protein LOC128996334 [Macrosteles quadrilineatus]|uniref:uncharacterized protein LOC128996334 n=1 Tax=Macrosteles quadrilineatus TaxID=74068 RepID=UPI0023E2B871|nr:uncharacterized protein LOC128996334 [Macrosteles quadrilineatus]
MFFESLLFLLAITINSLIFYFKKLKNASKLSICVGVASVVVGGILSFTVYYHVFPSEEKVEREFDQNVHWKDAKSVYNFTVKNIKGENVSLADYKGHVLLIVNVASECGFTDENYEELVELDKKYRESKGLRILAFPCNQFGEQEPGTNEEICRFAEVKGAKFDLFDKINVNGENAHPLWKYLKYKMDKIAIEWNFAKFVVDKSGRVVRRFHPDVTPFEVAETLAEVW